MVRKRVESPPDAAMAPARAEPGWTCPHCEGVSHDLSDIADHYCPSCTHYCDDVGADGHVDVPLF